MDEGCKRLFSSMLIISFNNLDFCFFMRNFAFRAWAALQPFRHGKATGQ
jgi:hypothetical protein